MEADEPQPEPAQAPAEQSPGQNGPAAATAENEVLDDDDDFEEFEEEGEVPAEGSKTRSTENDVG